MMALLVLAMLGAMWAGYLLPARRHSPNRSVEDFERNMDLLADTDANGPGRYIITPRKGMAFVGSRERAKERARERRRRVFMVLIESIGLTALIGFAPPLRVMWYATAILLGLLGLYVWMLMSMKASSDAARAERFHATEVPERATASPQRYATDAASRTPRPAFNGLAAMSGDELTAIVVKPARELGVAGV